jgi:hypothetical protein
MKSKLALGCLAGMLALVPCTTQAQGRRYGVVQSPFGPLYDTRSPEWRMAGGDMMLYEQIMEQRMMLQQQQMLMKQQQMMLKQQKDAKKGTQSGASANANNPNGFGWDDRGGNTTSPRTRKKQRGTVAAHASKATGKRSAARTPAATRVQSKPSSRTAADSAPKPAGSSPSSDAAPEF